MRSVVKYPVWVVMTAALAIVLGVAGCQRRPLEDPDFYTKVKINVNVKSVQNVTCDIYNPDIPVPKISPEVMHVSFYNVEGDKLLAESFISNLETDAEGNISISGNVSILPGEYKMMAYQFGEERAQVGQYRDYREAYAYTDPLSESDIKSLSLKANYASIGQKLRYQPEHIVAAHSDSETIPYHQGVYTIEAQAGTLVQTYYLQVGINGAEYVSMSRAVITSMSPGVRISTGKEDVAEPCAIYIPLIKSEDKGRSVICNVFNTFGRVEDSTNKLYLSFDVRTVDGQTITKEYDITELFKSEMCVKHHWLIIDDVIDIPKPVTPTPGGGGFDPSVKDWEDEHYDISI